ncbi:MAG TPA: cyclopropane fatty acyl phospholipid synthase [Spirochaetota bacterium]|nr:cyclopropane fatty acyl phospholipid synthase [Spirochaetota bacterium]HPG49250.1 cyclopropane fatty acyl phospholipid synthase [Spirochaetota bacterium]HPN13438.1 cyclopropane fatty acyl phospholipid synthase [Spirochaetota bacterium]HQL83017.1 cyclopropane fatty acyl phospholipid synthase [Spirochaetota bacterium]
MTGNMIREHIETLFTGAGIRIDGDRPWDIKIHDSGLFSRVLKGGSLALGESYSDGWWDCEALDQFFQRIFNARLNEKVNPRHILSFLGSLILNMQNRVRSRAVIDKHYDLDVNLYLSFLDPYNQYTCGYFNNTDDLDRAQEQKLDLICRKLMLSPDDSILDIGCGWGGFARFAAERYGCAVTGVTISDEQIRYASDFCKNLPVSIVKSDYRDLKGSFDKVLVCGMIEHVGYKNYRKLMEVVYNSLKDRGLFLLQTIGSGISARTGDPWINKYIFPNGLIPSAKQIIAAAEGLFTIEDWHFMGEHYDRTLMAWYGNFVRNWDRLKSAFDERFFRIWKYYFLSCAASFRTRINDLWQIVFSKNVTERCYSCVR